jgi:hypothetical protein
VKQAALTPKVSVFCLILHLPAPPVTPIFTPPEKEQLKKPKKQKTPKNLGQSGLNRENGFSLMREE